MDHHKQTVYVFEAHPHGEDLQHSLLAKFLIHPDGHFSTLEDHGLLAGRDFSELPQQEQARRLYRIAHSQRFKVATGNELKQGHYPELLSKMDKGGSIPRSLGDAIAHQLKDEHQGPRVSSFEYHREGMPGPQELKISGRSVYLDGQKADSQETRLILQNLKSGKAVLRHRLDKSEEPLVKIEPHLAQALNQVRAAVNAGHVHPDSLQALTRHIFSDSMIPSLGNKMAYNDFRSKDRGGVHIHLDGNDFGSINKMHDHETGNQAIVAMGNALRAAMDEAVGRKNGKLFRTGGDEFVAHVPSHEHAAAFARSVRAHMEKIPTIKGTHKLSMSLGWGPTSEHAERGLQIAKGAKKAANAPLGQAKTHAASGMPGQEGHLDLDAPAPSPVKGRATP